MIYHCCDKHRRNDAAKDLLLNGIDYLEVWDKEAPADDLRQRTLLVRLLKEVPPGLTRDQVVIEGGERIRTIGVTWAAKASNPPAEATNAEKDFLAKLPEPQNVLVVRVDRYGDFSPYRLRLVRSALDATPPKGFDPKLSDVDFSFKAECPSDLDCRQTTDCSGEEDAAPVIDYLAKDYPSFRRLILDRITQLVPGWRERSAADLGVALAEVVAYVGDQLSYQQDAIATEAYLGTARLRTSLRRHALLVDYRMHDGCNARTWVHLHVNADAVPAGKALRFYSRVPDARFSIEPNSLEDRTALRASPVVFEPIVVDEKQPLQLFQVHNGMPFYTWGDKNCCLSKQATSATLEGTFGELKVGDFLLFEEVVGPETGREEDADPRHRHVVRLTSVRFTDPDDATQPLKDPLWDKPITEIEWHQEDALPFALCLSAEIEGAQGTQVLENVSVARGNIVPADQGFSKVVDNAFETVPAGRIVLADRHADHCERGAPIVLPPRYAPQLADAPLTCSARTGGVGKPGDQRSVLEPTASAAAAMRWSLDDVYPVLTLSGEATDPPWIPMRDLLNSGPDDTHFVVEVENDGSARLRFGDDSYGRRPRPGTDFKASYRIGNGTAGNIGADTIAHVVSSDPAIEFARNPLPARGGADPEDDAHVRRSAPQAFRRQERAVTPDDYAEVGQRHRDVQRAAAQLRWTGSWHTVFVAADRYGGAPVDLSFRQEFTRHLDRYRMAGHDTEVVEPRFVSLEIELLVCVLASYLRSDIRAGLLDVLSNRVLGNGLRGLFHPDNLTFGQPAYLSSIYTAARQVAGIGSVQATCFKRQGQEDNASLHDGIVRVGRFEVARLDNDPNFLEHGVLRLTLFGGK